MSDPFDHKNAFPQLSIVNYEGTGHIIDDQMHDIMVKSFSPGCWLTAGLHWGSQTL